MQRIHPLPTVLALLTGLAPTSAQAATQEVLRPNAVIADLGLHVISLGYQRTLDPFLTVQATAGLYVPWLVNGNLGGLAGDDPQPPRDVRGGVLRLRCFIHPLGRAPSGLWISPFAQLGVVNGRRGDEELLGSAFAAGLSLGWAWRVRARWLISLGAGGQLHRAAFTGPSGEASSIEAPGFVRFGPTIDLNTGIAF